MMISFEIKDDQVQVGIDGLVYMWTPIKESQPCGLCNAIANSGLFVSLVSRNVTIVVCKSCICTLGAQMRIVMRDFYNKTHPNTPIDCTYCSAKYACITGTEYYETR